MTKFFVQMSTTSQNMYPTSKCCSFLAIDYYEEMSNTFEEFLSESLISESTSVLDEACYPLHKIDAFYRTPWHKIDFDSEFIQNEAEKLNESLSSFSCSDVFQENNRNIDIENEFEALPLRELRFEEKNLEDVTEELNEGNEILDVPPVPDFILQRKQNSSSILKALEEMPMLEIKEIFKELDIPSVDDSDVLVDYNPLKNTNVLKRSKELAFGEITIPESQCKEVETEITLCSEESCIFNCSSSIIVNEPPGELAIKNVPPDDIAPENANHSNFKSNSCNQSLEGIAEKSACDDTSNEKVVFDLNEFNLAEKPEADVDHECLEPEVILKINDDLKNSGTDFSNHISGKDSAVSFEKFSCSQSSNSAMRKVSTKNSNDSANGKEFYNPQGGVLFDKSSLAEKNFHANRKNALSMYYDAHKLYENSQKRKPEASTSSSVSASICDLAKFSCSQNNSSVVKNVSFKDSYDFASSNGFSNSLNGVLFNKYSLEEKHCQHNRNNVLSMHDDASSFFEDSEKSITETSAPVSDSICDLAKFSCSQNNSSVLKNVSGKDSYDFASSNGFSSSLNGVLFNKYSLEEKHCQHNRNNVLSMHDDASSFFEDSEKSITETSAPVSDSICDLAKFSCSQNNSSAIKKISNDFPNSNELSKLENGTLFNNAFLEDDNFLTNNNAVLSMQNDTSDSSEKRETATSPALTVKVSSFLEKLSKKDFQKNVEFSIANLENLISATPLSCNSSTACRDKISKQTSEFDLPKRDVSVKKKKCKESFDFLNTYISVKNNVAMSLKPARAEEEVKIIDNYEHNTGSKAEQSFNLVPHVVNSCDLFANLNDIVTELPKEFVEAFRLYERAAAPVIKKLFERDQFPLPLDATLIDISPDLTRFLLNQEMKFSRDANVNPVLGGAAGSYYIQLLTLHGILKSLYSLTHFSPKIALSCLMEYEKTHSPFLKNCYDDLKINLSNAVSQLDEIYPVHPKVLKLCEFLKEKFSLCEEHMCTFKALIITSHHLSYLYTSLRTAIKKEFCSMSIDLIPENIVLNQNCVNFRNNENCTYVTHSNSISKKMPWKDVALVLEYENCNTNWKDICCKNSIPHAFVKVSSSGLKLITDFKENITTDVVLSSSLNLRPTPLVVSEVITSNYEVMKFLDSRKDVLLCERNYQRILPQMYFADIVFDEKTAAIILEKVLFGDTDCMSVSFEKIIFLTLKYEFIWIIIHETDVITDDDLTVFTETQANFFQFYLEVLKLREKSSVFKTMFLFVDSNEGLTGVIADLLAFRLKIRTNFVSEDSIFSRDLTKEEIFLASFPSLNPFVIDTMLHFHCLDELICMTLDTLLSKYSSIPERFLSRFHYAINMNVVMFDDFSQKSSDDEEDEFNCPPSKSDGFEFCPITTELPELVEEYANPAENLPCTSLYKHTNDFEKTLEEIDRDYLACKYSPSFDNNMNVDFIANDEEIDEIYVQPKMNRNFPSPLPFAKKIKIESKNTVVVRPMFENSKWSQNDNELHNDNNYSHRDDLMKQNFLRYSPEKKGTSNFIRTKSNAYENNHSVSKISDIKKFMYNRKNYQPSIMRTLSQPSPSTFPSSVKFSQENKNLSRVRVNKGLCSQTVSKLDIMQNSPTRTKNDVETQRVSPIVFKSSDPFCNSKEVMAFEEEKYKETTKIPKFSFDHNLITDSDWMSQTNVRLTPFEGKRLQYERVPGLKGQTRLVFQ